jgi:hypothetical protein
MALSSMKPASMTMAMIGAAITPRELQGCLIALTLGVRNSYCPDKTAITRSMAAIIASPTIGPVPTACGDVHAWGAKRYPRMAHLLPTIIRPERVRRQG